MLPALISETMRAMTGLRGAFGIIERALASRRCPERLCCACDDGMCARVLKERAKSASVVMSNRKALVFIVNFIGDSVAGVADAR